MFVFLDSSASSTSADPRLDSEEQAFVTLINNYRAQRGLEALSIDWDLQASSDWMSADMGENAYSAHTDSLGRNPWTRICNFGYCYNTWMGENIAAGFTTANDLFVAWQNSPDHNANLLSGNYHAMGISRVYIQGSRYGWYWTSDFGGVNSNATPPGSAAPTPTPTFTPSPSAPPTRSPSPTPSPTRSPSPTSGPSPMPSLPPFWTGVNVWGLAANDTGQYSCGSAGGNFSGFLDSTFSALRAAQVNVVRFWAFQPYAMATSDGHRDWTAIDLVMSKAREYGIYLIPVLDNNWNDCSFWPISLYPNGHTGDGYTVSNTAYAAEFATRYTHDPAVYVIEVMNEDRETAGRQSFKDDLKARVDAVKANTSKPVGIGNDTDGTGTLSVSGVDLAYLDTYAYVGATIATSHDYADWNVGFPGSPACLQNSICWQYHQAQSLSLPFYIGESGADTCDNATKASALRAKLQAAEAAGIAGVIYWSFDIRTSPGNCGFEIGPGGPTLAEFANFRLLDSSPTGNPTASPSRTPSPTPRSTHAPTREPTAVPAWGPSLTQSATPTSSPRTTLSSGATPQPTPTPTSTPVPTSDTLTPALSTTATPSGTISPPISGDTDCDGKINSNDVLHLLQSVAEIESFEPSGCAPNLDVNCDNHVDARDALRVLLVLAGDDAPAPRDGCPAIGG